MGSKISRREFLKTTGAIAGIAIIPKRSIFLFSPTPKINYIDPFPRQPEQDQGMLGRAASFYEIDLMAKPRDGASIVGKRYRDQVFHIYEEVIPPDSPAFYNRLWYRVWGGYIHSAHIQQVRINLNEPASEISKDGVLAEVTVPYTTAYQLNPIQGWIPWRGSRLYYESTHWLTDLVEGPDGKAWYQITSELAKSEIYYAPSRHFRIIPPEEFSPLSTDVPVQNKRIEVSINEQMLRAFEYDTEIFRARISSGIPSARSSKDQFPTATPIGNHRIYVKQPSKHMGSVAGGAEIESQDGFSLPGVPWSSFFKNPGGYALHGTYWHNNFGLQMSHGCVNMRNEDARWIFRWSHPVYSTEISSYDDWDQSGYGTEVVVY
jgi:lipoprotein-anchoring transpeptidase ErfK/SrfK